MIKLSIRRFFAAPVAYKIAKGLDGLAEETSRFRVACG
jgi:hypothetical protein